MSVALQSAPEQGQLVTVRSRNWIVNEVAPSTLPRNALHGVGIGQTLVSLSSVEDDGLGEEIQVLWELEPGARIIEKVALPDPSGFDPPDRLDAFLDAARLGAASTADLLNFDILPNEPKWTGDQETNGPYWGHRGSSMDGRSVSLDLNKGRATSSPYSSRIIKAGVLLSDAKTLLSHWDLTTTVRENLDRIGQQNVFGKSSRSRVEDILAIFRQRYLVEPEVTRASSSWLRIASPPAASIASSSSMPPERTRCSTMSSPTASSHFRPEGSATST